MRDWPEPDQDTLLDILEVWDLGDYKEAQAERAETEYYEEIAKAEEAEANTQSEDDPYADWTPNTCHCCGTTDLSPSSSHCQSCSQSMEYEALGAQYHEEYEEYAQHQKILEKLWKEVRIAKLHAGIAHARADIVQAEANIARIQADITAAKSEITNANLVLADEPTEEDYYWAGNKIADAEINLVEAETSLVEAEIILAKTRSIGSVYAAVARAKTDVKYAEAKVQVKKDAKDSAIEIKETSEREYHVEESNLLTEGAHVEYILFPEQQNGIIEIGFCSEDVHIEYVNALIDLAEVQDALDLTEVHLVKTPLLCISRGYGFASNEPRCPFESSLTEHNKRVGIGVLTMNYDAHLNMERK